MKVFKKDRCLLVYEKNHYTGEYVETSILNGLAPNDWASSAVCIADYFITKMMNPLAINNEIENHIAFFTNYLKKREEAKIQAAEDWDYKFYDDDDYHDYVDMEDI